jgi:uncharacterized protein YxeA
VEEKKKRVRKKKVEAPAEEDRTVTAYYMLAQVVEHNTMMMKAFIDMIIAKENSMVEEPAEETPQPHYDDEFLKNILKQVYESAGKETAMKLLASHNAEKVSQISHSMKEAFVECARQTLKQIEGDLDERQ